MADEVAIEIVIKALTLRRLQPHLTARDVLDQVIRGHTEPINFGNLALPPNPFALPCPSSLRP